MEIKSPLIPERVPKRLDYETWNQHTSEEHKWELWDGVPFSTTNERDRLASCLIYSMGLEYFINELLPEQSKNELIQLLEICNKNT